MSWCLVIDSDRSDENGNVFTLPDLCRQTAIVLEMLGTSLDDEGLGFRVSEFGFSDRAHPKSADHSFPLPADCNPLKP